MKRAVYSEQPDDWVENMARILRKFDTARELVPAPVVDTMRQRPSIGIIAYGTTRYAIEEARDRLAADGHRHQLLAPAGPADQR